METKRIVVEIDENMDEMLNRRMVCEDTKAKAPIIRRAIRKYCEDERY